MMTFESVTFLYDKILIAAHVAQFLSRLFVSEERTSFVAKPKKSSRKNLKFFGSKKISKKPENKLVFSTSISSTERSKMFDRFWAAGDFWLWFRRRRRCRRRCTRRWRDHRKEISCWFLSMAGSQFAILNFKDLNPEPLLQNYLVTEKISHLLVSDARRTLTWVDFGEPNHSNTDHRVTLSWWGVSEERNLTRHGEKERERKRDCAGWVKKWENIRVSANWERGGGKNSQGKLSSRRNVEAKEREWQKDKSRV